MSPILLVPGLSCTAEVFAPQIAALWPYGPITIASTLTGRTMAEMAAAILHDAPPRFALAGISMGGYLSFELMRQAGERITRLALISTSARPDTPEQTAARRTMMAAADRGGFRDALAIAVTAIVHPSRSDDAALSAINLRMGMTIGAEACARQQEAVIARPDSRPGLAAIKVPTLVIVGDSDPVTPPERAGEMAAAIPGARLVTIPMCGHASTLEQPEAVNRALIDWITGDTT